MKKIMRIFGVAAPITLAFGALFKIMHWPAAGILMVLGFFLLSFLFLPSAIYVSYIEVSNRTKKWTYFAGFTGLFFLSISFMFKIMHWPGTGFALLISLLLLGVLFLPSLIFHKIRQKEITSPKYIFILALLGILFYLFAFCFKMMHWPGATVLFFGGSLLLIFIAFPLYVYDTYKKADTVENSFIFIVIVLVWFIVPTTLLSLNVSSNVLSTLYVNEQGIESGIQMLNDKNKQLLVKLDKTPAAYTIDNQSKELIHFIQQVKVDMVKIADGANAEIGLNNAIDLQKIENTNAINIQNMVFFNKDKRAEKLNAKLNSYRSTLNKVINSPSATDSILVFNLRKEESFDEVLLLSLNKLSYLQMNILLTEQIALKKLSKIKSKTLNE